MSRLDFLNHLRAHPMIYKDFDRLNAAEVAWLESFIKTNAALTLAEYATLVNRMEVTDQVIRPKNRSRVWALLLEAVTLEHMTLEKRRPK